MGRRAGNSRIPFFGLFVAAATARPAFAHEGQPIEPHDLWGAWSLDPVVIAALVISAWLYFRGWRRLQTGRTTTYRRAGVAFICGWLACFIALISPLDALGGSLFAAHMVQHEILMLVAAPLLILGRPLAPTLLALPAKWRRRLVGVGKIDWVQTGWRWMLSPLPAWLIHAFVLWLWHLPSLFQMTIENDGVHAAQHLSFLISALIFCEALFFGGWGQNGRIGHGASVIYLFTTAIHTSVLGALLTFSSLIWYPIYETTTAAWGLTPLEDQQLGGLIMWVPAGLFYVALALWLLAAWLRESERQVLRNERSELAPTGRK